MKVRRREFVRLFTAAPIAMLTAAPAWSADPLPQKGGKLVYMSENIPSLNPLDNESTVGVVTGQVFASLTRLDEKQKPIPYLAKSWEISSDGLSYTFHLQPGAKFHDGKPITSEDVAFSVGVVLKFHRFGKQMFGPVTSVETPDAQTAVFKLSRPHAPVLLSTTMSRFLPIMPKHVYGTQEDFNSNPAHKHPTGSGPFVVSNVKLGSYIILDRFPNYFLNKRPYLDRIVIQIVSDQTAVRVGLQRLEFDLVSGDALRYRAIKSFKSPQLKIERTTSAVGALTTIEFNNRTGPLSHKKVRQAIGHAIDTNFVASTLHDGWTLPGRGPFPIGNPFFNESIKGYEFDLDKANKLLDEAGFPVKADGVRFELKLIYISNEFLDLFVTIPEYVKPSLKKVGIEVVLEPMPGAAAWAVRMQNWDFEMSMALPAAYLDPGIGISRTYVCDNIRHVAYSDTSGFCNKKVDELFHEGVAEPNFDKRKALYDQVQTLLWEEAPMIWVVDLATPLIYNAKLINPPLTGWNQYGPFDEMYWRGGSK
ncbi:MAG: hypothetical protein EPN46_13160 [Candidimonas sp.]|nr:MAG: hypothetical protein EPN77_05715 [Candidimonas sp.]TAM25746.1 MAG: hypothetical protein EPN62_03260 [Candidimonas sp.]TAM74045.1 MAG: hypothetical protein EPN46_13160 [Candidimonas sp.]